MREALARTEHDFLIYDQPKRRGAFAPRVRTALGVLWRRPMRTLGVAAFAGVAVAVLVNALVLQARRHPAPLFGEPAAKNRTVIRLGAPAPVPPQLRVALPLARPSELPAPVEAPAAIAPAARPARDPIGDMIRRAEPQVEPQHLVLSAQRALVKLGYGPLKADGLMGAGTRLAVERFEKDKALPTTGTLNPRVVRALAAAAGMPVE